MTRIRERFATSADRKENRSLGNAEKEVAEFAPGSNLTVNMSEIALHFSTVILKCYKYWVINQC